VTFLPKPLAGYAGSGCHCHISLWKVGKHVLWVIQPQCGLLYTLCMAVTAIAYVRMRIRQHMQQVPAINYNHAADVCVAYAAG
jgi:glutamine synthetase